MTGNETDCSRIDSRSSGRDGTDTRKKRNAQTRLRIRSDGRFRIIPAHRKFVAAAQSANAGYLRAPRRRACARQNRA